MTVFTLIVALLLEQIRPLAVERVVLSPVRAAAAIAERHLNAGEVRHGAVAWLLLVGGATAVALVVHLVLDAINPVLAWVWNLAVLYATLGFRQTSHHFTEIHLALRLGELDRARQALAAWRGRSAGQLGSTEVARLAIEAALKASHRQVFAIVFFYAILPGPAGAVLYRLSELVAECWTGGDPATARFGAFAKRAFALIDWLPQRLTATAFAVVGDFEDAVYCWRTQASRWSDEAMGVILASGGGALGVRLGMPVVEGPGEVTDRPDLGIGEDADVEFMQGTVGLVWRSLVLWLLLLFVLSLARWVGG